MVEGGQRELLGEAAHALDLETVVDDQGKHADGHAQGGVGVGGRHQLHVLDAEAREELRRVVHRHQLEQVHQEDPDEQRQRQRRDHRVAAMEGAAHGELDELDDHLDDVLQRPGHPGGGHAAGLAEQPDEQQAHGDGPTHGIQMDRPEAHLAGLLGRMGQRPAVLGMVAEGQVLEVVLYVVSRRVFTACCHAKVTSVVGSTAHAVARVPARA